MEMIKRYNEIKISDFSTMEDTGKISHYKKWYNLFPVKWYLKDILKLIHKIETEISELKADSVTAFEWQITSLLRINELDSLFNIISNHLVNGIDIKIIKNSIRINRRIRRKLKYNDSTLSIAIDRINELTGINIKELKDVERLRKKIEFLKDKYNEAYKTEVKNEKVTLFEYASMYVMYIGAEFAGLSNMKIIEFVAMKKQADKKIEAEKLSIDKIKSRK